MTGEDLTARFRTHAHYIEAFAVLAGIPTIGSARGSLEDLKERANNSGIVSDKGTTSDLEEVSRRLRHAWGTELLLAMSSQWDVDDEFVRLSNTWGVVQAYYATYHITQALIVARGDTRPTTHPKTQGHFTALWVKRKILLPPWTFGFGHGGVSNVDPTITVDPNIHGWSRCDGSNAWSIAAKALRTSRAEKIVEAAKAKRFEMQRANKKSWQIEEDFALPPERKREGRPRQLCPC